MWMRDSADGINLGAGICVRSFIQAFRKMKAGFVCGRVADYAAINPALICGTKLFFH
jgi:hypothetical protein